MPSSITEHMEVLCLPLWSQLGVFRVSLEASESLPIFLLAIIYFAFHFSLAFLSHQSYFLSPLSFLSLFLLVFASFHFLFLFSPFIFQFVQVSMNSIPSYLSFSHLSPHLSFTPLSLSLHLYWSDKQGCLLSCPALYCSLEILAVSISWP